MSSYKVTVVLEPAGNSSIAFKEPVMVDGITLRTDDPSQNHRPKIYAEFELKSEDGLPQIENYAYSEIEKRVLPIIIFLSKSPYRIKDIKIGRLPEIYKRGTTTEVYLFDTIRITDEVYITKTLGNAQAEISSLLERLNRIDSESKSVLVRVIKYWNRAMGDPDPIDRFLNLYIALELLKGLSLRKEPSEKKREWVNTLYEKYIFNGLYGGYKINYIRNALLHYQKKVLSKEEAERIIEKHVDEFAREIFNLMKDYVECGGDTECLQKKRQQRNRS
ncbi:protein of unknown function [Thermococcus nautili]|uniref:hypothetical protein n=1 Tax=Thermococcus nautili TaxID=195522 RepID=UPI002555A89F|nr:hypothetical protein [Thermococcus nautili]CAI1492366.1 protein of unknown function [Thermococcus nautili]